MTIKNFQTGNHGVFMTSLQDSYGGQDLRIDPGHELMELMAWWRQWSPVFKDSSPTVQDALVQARVLHELSKEQDAQPKTYGWTETTL